MIAMNLARHITVLWRFRAVVLVGLLLGIVLAVLAAYQVPSMERRGIETWTAESDVLVTQRGFPEGRVTPCIPASTTGVETSADAPCADQGRFVQLALYYAQVAVSDEVRTQLPERPARGTIEARNVDATGNGQGWLPIIKLSTTASSAEAAVALNNHTIDALRDYLKSNQSSSRTPEDDRVQLSVLNQPSPLLLSGRSMTVSLLALMLCLLGAVAVAHILENLRPRESVGFDFDPALDFEPPVVATANGHARDGAWNGAAEHEPSPSRRTVG
jgi:hypothetical protein